MAATRESISVSHLLDDVTCHVVTAAAFSFRDEETDIYQSFEIAACEIVRNVRAYSVRGTAPKVDIAQPNAVVRSRRLSRA